MISITLIFYILTLKDPGFVPKRKNFHKLVEKLLAENYHLDYVCIHCETLQPENSDHCNFCNRCVQKFDHHCVFVNNCLGYKNHKYFLLFLFFYTFYLFGLLLTRILSAYHLFRSINVKKNDDDETFNYALIALDIYLLLVILLFAPICFMQLKS